MWQYQRICIVNIIPYNWTERHLNEIYKKASERKKEKRNSNVDKPKKKNQIHTSLL